MTSPSTGRIAKEIEEYNNLAFGDALYETVNGNAKRRPFYTFGSTSSEANWSDTLEDMHDEAKTDAHPIDLYERKTVLGYLGGYLSEFANPVIADFGCGAGFMLHDVEKESSDSTLIGIDIIESGLYKLHKKSPDYLLFKFDITSIPFPDNFLDCLICLNVLEHIQDDAAVLREFNRILKPDGVACIVVPFGDKLYDYYDEALMHVRRYAKNELVKKLQDNGFRVVRHVFLSSLMFIPFFFKKKLNRVLYKSHKGERLDKVSMDVRRSGWVWLKPCSLLIIGCPVNAGFRLVLGRS